MPTIVFDKAGEDHQDIGETEPHPGTAVDNLEAGDQEAAVGGDEDMMLMRENPVLHLYNHTAMVLPSLTSP